MPGANRVRDVALGKWPREVCRQWLRVLDDGVPDRACDLVLARVREADVQDRVAVVLRQVDRAVNGLQNVGLDELALSEHAYAGAVALQDLVVLGELG